MARFYAALATDGSAPTPHIATQERPPNREKLLHLTPEQMRDLRVAMASVITEGTARSARLPETALAGKTGTAQNPHGRDHAWFVGFAPAEAPKIVVAVMLEFGEHGYSAAQIASKIIGKYLRITPTMMLQTDG